MKLNVWLRWGIVIGVLAVFLTPFIVANPLFFPFITGKGFAFRILVEIVFTLWLILALRDPSVRPRKSLLFFAMTAFVVVIGIADLLGANPFKSFWSNFERMEGWIGLIHLYAFFVVLWSTFREAKWWRMLFETTIAVSVIEALYGVLQLAGKLPINQGGVRVDGTFGNATYLAVYMLFSLFFTALAFYWWGRNSKYIKWWYALAGILQLVMIFYTATRGTILGLVGGLFVASLVFLIFGKSAPTLKKAGIAVLIALAVIAGGFYAVRGTSFIQNHEVFSRIANISISDGATRFAIWNMALKGFAERPVLGWGQESFNYIFNKYYEPSMYAQEPWFDRAHNEFLDWLVAGGIVGFALWISLFVLALWYLWRPTSSFHIVERGIITGLISAYAFHDLFVFDNLLSYILFFTVLAYLAHRSEESSSAPMLSAKPVSTAVFSFTAPVIVGVMVAVFYFANVPGMATAYNLIEALKPHTEGVSANIEFLKKAEATTGLGRQEAREQGIQFSQQAKSANIGDAAFQDSLATFVASQMADEIAQTPDDARLRIFLGSFLRQIGKNTEALVEITKAHELSPKKQQIMFELGTIEIIQGNATGAVSWFKQAYDLAPEYETARFLYAAVLIRTGQGALAESILKEKFGDDLPDSDILLQAYFDVRDYAHVIAIAKGRVLKDPTNIKSYVQLAAAYLESGNRLDAVRALQSAIAVDPTFKAQGEYYIQEITAGRTP